MVRAQRLGVLALLDNKLGSECACGVEDFDALNCSLEPPRHQGQVDPRLPWPAAAAAQLEGGVGFLVRIALAPHASPSPHSLMSVAKRCCAFRYTPLVKGRVASRSLFSVTLQSPSTATSRPACSVHA